MDTPFVIDGTCHSVSNDMDSYSQAACDEIERIYNTDKWYPRISVHRSWLQHNPVISGELARPRAYHWYLLREFTKLLSQGAAITISASRKRVPLTDISVMDAIDEDVWDFSQKKLFLFRPERIELSLNRIAHYTGTDPNDFQRYILFTNYDMHAEIFKSMFPECIKSERAGVQMPVYHHKMDDNLGISLINIGVGPSNAKTITDHISVLRPDAMIMVGHCGGLRNNQSIGDYVLATGFMRDDYLLDDLLPLNVPVIPNYILNKHLYDEIIKRKMNVRIGTVFTTGNRNWEFSVGRYEKLFHVSRSVAIDMESATIVANGFRYRVPASALLAVSDRPLHGRPKMSGQAEKFYTLSKELHLDIVMSVLETSRKLYRDGFPNDAFSGLDDSLLGSV